MKYQSMFEGLETADFGITAMSEGLISAPPAEETK